MSSLQDIDTRLAELHDLLNFWHLRHYTNEQVAAWRDEEWALADLRRKMV
jgi:hypothetical protein